MAKRKKKRRTSLISSALILPVGAIAVGALPDAAPGVAGIKSNVLGGMSKLSTFAKPAAAIGGAGVLAGLGGRVNRALKNLN